MHFARDGLTAQLPEEWKAYQNSQGEIFYFNRITRESSWDHPSDAFYRNQVLEARALVETRGGISIPGCNEKHVIHHSTAMGIVEPPSTDLVKATDASIISLRARLFSVAANPEVQVTA